MKTIYKKTIFLLYALLVFFTPLIFSPYSNEAFEFVKTFVLYFITIVISSIYLIRQIVVSDSVKDFFSKTFLIKFQFVKGIYLLLLLLFISTFLSNHVYTSLWGYFTRYNGGFFLFVSLVAILLISFNTFGPRDFRRLFFLSLLSSILVSFFGILQYYGFIDISDIYRVYSTFGQPNWLAQFLAMHLPLVIYLYTNRSLNFSESTNGFLFLSFILLFWCFWLTFSLSGILALLVSLIFLPKFNIRNYIPLLIISLIIIAMNFGFFRNRLHDAYIDTKNFITSTYTVYAEDVSNYSLSDSGFIRENLWKSSFRLVFKDVKTFFFGIGLQNFGYEYPAYRPLSLNYSSEWEYIINRPHNYYLEILVECGFLVFITFIYLIYKLFLKAPSYIKPVIVSFLITNIFGWPVMASSVFFVLVVSYVFSKEYAI